ncbi:hypothetical protein JCM8097_005451 [Rhodosporidiobolus ruineniae]
MEAIQHVSGYLASRSFSRYRRYRLYREPPGPGTSVKGGERPVGPVPGSPGVLGASSSVDPDDGGGGISLASLAAGRAAGVTRASRLVPSCGGGARGTAADFLHDLHGGNSQAAPGAAGGVEQDEDEQDDDYVGNDSSDTDADSTGRPPPVRRNPQRGATRIPRWVKAYRATLSRRAVNFNRNKSTKEPLISAWRMVAAELGCSVEEVQKVALGEHVTLAELRDSRPDKGADVPEALAALVGLQQHVRRSKSLLLDPFDWEHQFGRWATILELVNIGAGYEERRRAAFEDYHAFVQVQMRRASSASDPDRARRALLVYDDLVRADFTGPLGEAQLVHPGAAAPHDYYYMQVVLPAFGLPVAAAPTAAGRRQSAVRSSAPCRLWNGGHEHSSDDCPAPATHNLRSGGSTRRAGAGLGSALAVAAAETVGEEEAQLGEELWAPEGGPTSSFFVAADAVVDEKAPENPLPGLGGAPCILWSFHWGAPAASPPVSPSVDATLTVAPLPRPPPSVAADRQLRSLLRRRPHLFSTHSPLDHLALARGLASHPNREWVRSLVESVQYGFWPCHDGSAAKPPPPALKDRLFPSKRSHQAAQVQQAEAARKDGLLSEPFDDLDPAMTVNPQFGVEKEGAKVRMVDDHSASGLNDGIGEAPAMYDRLDTLVRILRYLGLVDGSLPESVIFWKLDVVVGREFSH